MTGESVAFVRKASGLRRDVSFLDAVTLNISNMSSGAALGVIGFTMVLLPTVSGVNLVYASVLAWLLSLPQVIVYTMMTTRISRTGGDYVWVSRTFGGWFGGPLAFMGYILEAFAYLGLIALACVFAVGSVGVSLGYENMLSLALPGNIPGADTTSQFILGALIFTILIAINIIRPKAGFQIVAILSIFGVLAILVGIFVLIGAGQQGTANYMDFLNSIGSGATYTSIVNSYSGPTFDFNATLLVLPFFAIFVYPWLNAAPAVASEIKGKSTLKWNVAISSVVTLLFVTAAFGSLYYAGGLAFTNAALANPKLVYEYSLNFWTLAMGVSNNVAVAWFLGLGWIAWNITVLAYGIIVVNRYLFAQAFDRYLPEKIAHVSKSGSPYVAYLIQLVGTVIMIGGASFLYGTLVSLYGAVIASMIYFIFIGVAAAVYASRKEKGGSKMLLGIAGVLMAIVFVYYTYMFLAYQSVWGGNLFAYGFVIISFVLGVIIYVISKSYYSKRGIDITLAYKELPPL